MKYTDDFLIKAHKHSFKNEEEIKRSSILGCFYCLKIYPLSDVTEDDFPIEEKTLFCPHCAIDSVIGDSSGLEINTDFLSAMKQYYF